jgi:hypothetical protein
MWMGHTRRAPDQMSSALPHHARIGMYSMKQEVAGWVRRHLVGGCRPASLMPCDPLNRMAACDRSRRWRAEGERTRTLAEGTAADTASASASRGTAMTSGFLATLANASQKGKSSDDDPACADITIAFLDVVGTPCARMYSPARI